jgi:hypothetical protein
MGIAALGIACLTLFGTYLEVDNNAWQPQGTARAILIGISLASFLIIYGIMCFRAFRAPKIKNIFIIYGVQSVLFFILMVLLWIVVFLPVY